MANNNKKIAEETTFKGDSPGKLLAKGRKNAKLSERDAADALKISVSRLKSIEEDDFSVFPSETYVRGHLRNYSRLLKEDEQKILDAYNSNKPDGGVADVVDMREEVLPSHASQKRWWIVYIVLVALALIWVLSYWMLSSSDESSSALSLDAQVAAEANQDVPLNPLGLNGSDNTTTSTATFDASSVSSLPNSNSSNDDEDSGSSREGADNGDLAVVTDGFSPSSPALDGENSDRNEQPIVVSQLTASELVKSIQAQEQDKQADVQPVIEGDTLEFGFANASWVQVTDATGTVLFKGLNKSGAELALNGKAPFRIVIGNVEGTSLVYNGESVSLDAPKGKNTLRLTLGG